MKLVRYLVNLEVISSKLKIETNNNNKRNNKEIYNKQKRI